jgi:hypothetical protein
VAALKLIFPEYRDSTQIGVQVGVSAVVLLEAERQRLIERWDKALVALASKGGETAQGKRIVSARSLFRSLPTLARL